MRRLGWRQGDCDRVRDSVGAGFAQLAEPVHPFSMIREEVRRARVGVYGVRAERGGRQCAAAKLLTAFIVYRL